MKSIKYAAIFLLVLSLAGTCASKDASAIVNMMVVADMPNSPTQEQLDAFQSSMLNIINEFSARKLNTTIYLTQDAAGSPSRLLITQLGSNTNVETAMSGNHTDEKLSSMTYVKQSEMLDRTKKIVEACHYCNANTITVKGFLPQSFDQNEGTFMVMDELGLKYDAGFQAGLLYAPGHEKDVWPYKYPDHNFYAVPVSTENQSGKKVVLQDSYLKSNGLSGSQWYDLLVGKLSDAMNNREPMVVILTASTSGSGDYLDSLKRFLDYAISNNVGFVGTMELVDMSTEGSYATPANVNIAANVNTTSTCKTCQSKSFGPQENISANLTLIGTKLKL